LVGAASLAGPTPARAQPPDFRLSGVLYSSDGRSLAIIERSAGSSVTVGQGDRIDTGYVAEIGDRYVRLSFPERDVLLPLSGLAGAVVQSTFAVNVRNGLAPDPAAPNIRQITNTPAFLSALTEIEDAIRASGSAAEEGSAGSKLAADLHDLLQLPDAASIKSVSGTRFGSATAGLESVKRLLSQNREVWFEMEREGELLPPFYVLPDVSH
jgi:hypothetical protein